MDSLLLIDGVTVCPHLKIRLQPAVAQSGLQRKAMVLLILQCQREVDGHVVVALADNLVCTFSEVITGIV